MHFTSVAVPQFFMPRQDKAGPRLPSLPLLPFPLLSLPFFSLFLSLPSPSLLSLHLLSGLLSHPPCLLLYCSFLHYLTKLGFKLDSFHPLLCLIPPAPILTPLDWLLRPWLPHCNFLCSLPKGAGGVGVGRATAWACLPSLHLHPLQGVSFPPQSWGGIYHFFPRLFCPQPYFFDRADTSPRWPQGQDGRPEHNDD